MPEYVFNGGDPRDYFPASIGRVNPGDKRTLDAPPDANWSLAPAVAPPAFTLPNLIATPAPAPAPAE